MNESMITPSYAQGFARSMGEAANPNLWRGLAGAWLPMLGPTGGTLYDISGRRNNGPFTSGLTPASWIVSELGAAIHFGGTNDYITVEDHEPLSLRYDDASLCVWVRYSGGQTESFGAIVGNGILANRIGHGLYVSNASQLIKYQVRIGSSVVVTLESDVALNDGKWHFVAGVLDRSSVTGIKLYVDGIPQADTGDGTAFSGVYLYDTNDYSIGSREDVGGYAFDFTGDIAYVSQYNRALSQNEIIQLYQDSLALVRMRNSVGFVSAANLIPSFMRTYRNRRVA